MLAVDGQGRARLWVTGDGTEIALAAQEGTSVFRGAFSIDGTRLLTVTAGAIHVREAATGNVLGTLLAHSGGVGDAQFSPAADRVAAHGDGSIGALEGVWIWTLSGNAADDPIRLTLSGQDGRLQRFDAMAFSPDGTRLATASADLGGDNGTVQVWDVVTGQPVGSPLSHPAYVRALAFSPDGARLVTGALDNAARVWSVEGTLIASTPAFRANSVRSVAFSPDGAAILTASDDASARVWSAATGEPLSPPMRHPGPVAVARFSADGRFVLTTGGVDMFGNRDDTARVWDVRTGARVSHPFAHGAGIEGATFAANATRLVTGAGTRVFVWDLTPDARPLDALVAVSRAASSRQIDAAGGETMLASGDALAAVLAGTGGVVR